MRSLSSCRCVFRGSVGTAGPSGIISSALLDLQVEKFRCITAAELEFAPKLNVFTGGNGAGKTSLLEAVFFLGRGRSFRGADNRLLIQSGASEALVTGRAQSTTGPTRVGVRISTAGADIHVGGQAGASAADLVSTLAVQAIHAGIGELAQGSPEARRRLLDWGVFHVKHDYLAQWRQFRRVLLQRNAVLRDNGPDALLDAWDGELAPAGEVIHQLRLDYLEQLRTPFLEIGVDLLGQEIGLRYQRGWSQERNLREALREGRDSDRNLGYTRCGPQRADLQFEIDEAPSRWRASKGQQKLLGATFILAQCGLVAEQGGQSVALIVDEPAADLDSSRLAVLMRAILRSPAQVFLASITASGLPLDAPVAMFHVEHGRAKALL